MSTFRVLKSWWPSKPGVVANRLLERLGWGRHIESGQQPVLGAVWIQGTRVRLNSRMATQV